MTLIGLAVNLALVKGRLSLECGSLTYMLTTCAGLWNAQISTFVCDSASASSSKLSCAYDLFYHYYYEDLGFRNSNVKV